MKDDPRRHTGEICHGMGGQWFLTTQEEKRILLNNIYGVDIDSQAVEVTKLSLLLKILEGENQDSLTRQLKMWRERALPDLGNNIKCGNSLIGPDFYDYQQMSLLDEDERYRINVFDWQAEFPEVFPSPFGRGTKGEGQGGFDAVIGNPPYGYMIPTLQQEYFSTHYSHQDYQKDLYLLFLERYEHFLRRGGLLGVIVSNTWLQSVTLRKIRKYLATNYQWLRILQLPDKVFRAVVDTHVLIFRRAVSESAAKGSLSVDIRLGTEVALCHALPWHAIPRTGDPINVSASLGAQNVLGKIKRQACPLAQICDVFNGIKPFEKGKGHPPQTEQILKDQPYVLEGRPSKNGWSPLLRGSLIHRYKNIWNKDYWIRYGPWLAAPRDPAIFNAPLKIMVRQTGDSIIATLVEQGFFARNNLHILLPRETGYDLRYALGIMNSRLMDFVYSLMNPEKDEALAEVKKQHVEQLPIRPINFSDAADKARHDKIVDLVEQMLELHKQSGAAKTPDEKMRIQRQIDVTDRLIDRLVYDLYGLTKEEVEMVEGSTKRTEK